MKDSQAIKPYIEGGRVGSCIMDGAGGGHMNMCLKIQAK